VTGNSHVEAEVLAAWAERRLPPGEATLVESHLATCAVCQEVLAVFAHTHEAVPDPSGAGFRWPDLVSGFGRIRWAIPVAAAATAAAIWVAIPERTGQDTFERTIAPAIETAAPSSAKESSPAAPAPAEETPQRQSRREAPALQDRADKQAPPPDERDQDVKSEIREGEARLSAAPQSAAAAPQAPAAPEQNRFSTDTVLQREAPSEVASPDPLVRWRIVPPGRLERSMNGGKTWDPAPLPEAVELVSVRAPAAATAIVTAADGRQFRTDDQGKTWNTVQP
jgi:hypothetical protein